MIRTSAQIRDQIVSIDPAARIVRTRVLAITGEIERRIKTAGDALLVPQGEPDPEHVDNALSFVFNFSRAPIVQELSVLRQVLDILESSEPYAVAVKVLDPLHAELAEAEAREAEEAAAIAAARTAVLEAEEAARQKLLAKVDADPALKLAKEKLAALAPA